MGLFRKKLEAEEFGRILTWEIGKYGKGAEAALRQLVIYPDNGTSTEEAVRRTVPAKDRLRFQLVFTITAAEVVFQSMRDAQTNKTRFGFGEEFAAFAAELQSILGVRESLDFEVGHVSADAAKLIRSNSCFRSSNGTHFFNEGDPQGQGSVFPEIAQFIGETGLRASASLAERLSDAPAMKRYASRIGLTIGAAFQEVSCMYRQVKLV